MAPSLPSCIGNAFCSHRQASGFLLATLIPLFFPVIILCVPFLILFLAPLSFFFLSYFLLHKVQALIQPKRSRTPVKGAFLRPPGFAEGNFLEEDKERRRYEDVPESEELDGENVHRFAASEGGHAHALHAREKVGSESIGEEHDDVKEAHASNEWDEKQEEGNVIEGMAGNREEGLSLPPRDKVEDAGSQVHVSPSTESSIALTKEEQDDMEGMLPKYEGKAMAVQGEDVSLEGTDGLREGALTHFPSTHEQGSSYSQPGETLSEEQGSRKVVPTVESAVHASDGLDEGPSKDGGDEIVEIAPHRMHEQGSSHFQPEETPELGSESMGDEHNDVKMAHASRELDKKQEEENVIEGMVENREEGFSSSHGERVEDEGLQAVASPSTESAVALTKEEQDDMMEGLSPKQDEKGMDVDEENVDLEGTGGNFQDEHSTSSSSDGLGERSLTNLPLELEQGSLHSLPQKQETISEEQATDLGKYLPTVESRVHGLEPSSFTHEQGSSYSQPKEVLSEEQGIVPGKVPLAVESGVHRSRDEFDEGLSKDGGEEIFEIGPHCIHEQGSSHSRSGESTPEEQGIEKDLNTGESGVQGCRPEFDEVASKDQGDEVDPHRIQEQGSSHFQPEETLPKEQGIGLGKELSTIESGAHGLIYLPSMHEQESSYSQPKEAPSEEPGIFSRNFPPKLESDVHGQMDGFDEGLLKGGGHEIFEIDPHRVDEQGSLHPQQGETPPEDQGVDLEKDLSTGESGVQGWTPEFDEVPSKDGGDEVDRHEQGSPLAQPEETPPEEQGIHLGRDLATGEIGVEGSMNEFEERPWKAGGDKIFETGTHHTHLGIQEHDAEEPALLFEKPSGPGSSGFKLGKPGEQESLSFREKEMEEGEPTSLTVTNVSEPWRAVSFAKELQDDARLQQGRPMSDLEVSSQSESPEQDRPAETSSTLESSTQGPLEDVGSQDKMQEKQRILADIDAIKKIIGYQVEDHASLMEQITALYLFLGMEPYECEVDVDDLEKARAEVELLKIVVGVK